MKIFSKTPGFTLAEVMVCLSILGVIASISLPVIKAKKPDGNRIMFKKAYSTLERAVSELINDPEIYPDKDGCVGFDNTDKVNDSSSGPSKFRDAVFSKLNTFTDRISNDTFTADGVKYDIPNTDFSSDVAITIDVNGSAKPNLKDNTSTCDLKAKVDIFTIYVKANGKMYTNGACAKEYMKDVKFTTQN